MEVLKYLNKNKSAHKYKGLRIGLFGLPDFRHYKYQTLANNLSILKKRGFIKRSTIGEYFITTKGKIFLENGKDILRKFETNKGKNSPKNLLITH